MDSHLTDNAISEALTILNRNMIKYHKSFPNQCATNGIYGVDNGFWADWHPGLYAGMYWTAYELSGDIKFRKYAECLEDILYNMLSDGNIWHSDMGLVYLPCVLNDIKYNKSEVAKQIIVVAADCLAEKMAHGGRFTDISYFAPNAHRTKQNFYMTQVNFLCNIQLLTMAAEITGNNKYISLAEGSMESVFKYNISSDGDVTFRRSVSKDTLIVKQKVATSEMLSTQDKHRGFGWSVWALARCYSTQKKEIFLNKFKLILRYLEARYFDNLLYAPNDEALNRYYDSAASSIALCGFLEMSRCDGVPSDIKKTCCDKAEILFNDIYENSLCTSKTGDECLIENGYKFYADKGFSPKTSGTIPGDYYWLQSLLQLKSR